MIATDFDLLVGRECILKTAKALVEDTKMLVSGAGASQEKLAQAAQSSVSTITKLADVVKLGAASLGSEDPETQVSVEQNCLKAILCFLAVCSNEYKWKWNGSLTFHKVEI